LSAPAIYNVGKEQEKLQNPTLKITGAAVLSFVEPPYHASTAISSTTGGVSSTANDGASFSCRQVCKPFMIEITTNKKKMLLISKQNRGTEKPQVVSMSMPIPRLASINQVKVLIKKFILEGLMLLSGLNNNLLS
jgi:hypothetical protein